MGRYTGLTLAIVIVLQGCSMSATKNAPANVTSEPSKATVYANGLAIGETPLHADLYKAFPASWIDWVYQASGVLMVKKEGCQDFVLKVNDYILSKPIHAPLECHAVVKNEAETPVKDSINKPAVTSGKSKASSAIEVRLRKLEDLHKKGLITPDEYKANRKRILDEL